MTAAAYVLLGGSAALAAYAYVGYPLLLRALARVRAATRSPAVPPASPAERDWPRITILVPAYNAAAVLPATLDALLALDYPPERRQVIVASDASTDGTDAIAAALAPRGVELVRLAERRGKTAAENLAGVHATGDIIVTVDATSRIPAGALKPLIAAFADPTVGVASGCDVSVAGAATADVRAEAGYVGYEMALRAAETRVWGIVGASGCFYAERAALYREPVPEHLSRDFAAPLVARRHGYRSVSVTGAVCLVRRSSDLAHEYRRKVRTVARGLATLWHYRALLDPTRYGAFAWMLLSHKVCRWLVPWALIAALGGILLLAIPLAAVRDALAGAGVLAAGAALGIASRRAPRWCLALGYVAAANLAVLHAWLDCWRGRVRPFWEPTVRGTGAATTRPAGPASRGASEA